MYLLSNIAILGIYVSFQGRNYALHPVPFPRKNTATRCFFLEYPGGVSRFFFTEFIS